VRDELAGDRVPAVVAQHEAGAARAPAPPPHRSSESPDAGESPAAASDERGAREHSVHRGGGFRPAPPDVARSVRRRAGGSGASAIAGRVADVVPVGAATSTSRSASRKT
jgi:hypothetical protein